MSKLKKIVDLGEDIWDYGELPIITLTLNKMPPLLCKRYRDKLIQYKHAKIRHYIDSLVKLDTDQDFSAMKYNDNAPIWFCWLQGEANMPLITKLCYEKLKLYANNHPIKFVTWDNWQEYVTLPKIIVDAVKSKKIKMAHFADILRIALLYEYGGLWLDSTILLTKSLDENIFTQCFWSIKQSPISGYISECKWSVFCLASWEKNPFMKYLLDSFEQVIQKNTNFIDYLLMDYLIDYLYNKDAKIHEQIDLVPFNNPNLYELKKFLTKEYSDEVFAKIKQDTNMFKLNWRQYSDNDLLGNAKNFYNYLNREER